jgi:predicted nucleic acid-binding protein
VILADTSIWIEFLRQSNSPAKDRMIVYLEEREIVTVSAVFGELMQVVKNNNEYETILDFWKNTPKIAEQMLFIEAGKLSSAHKLYNSGIGLLDCYILAGAISSGYELWTFDKKLSEAYKRITGR